MLRCELQCPEITIGGVVVECCVQLSYHGAYHVALSTTIPAFDAELYSSYLGHPRADIAASHLSLSRDRCATDVARFVNEGECLRDDRQLVLLDHLQRVRELLAEISGQQVSIDVDDGALAALQTA